MDDIAREPVTDESEMKSGGRRRRTKGPSEVDERDVTDETAASADEGGPAEEGAEVEVEAGPPPKRSKPAEEAPEVAPIEEPAELGRVLLGLLLVSREAVPLLRLAQACDTTQENVKKGLEALQEQLRGAGFPLEVHQAGDSARLLTLPEIYPYVERMRGAKKAERLSPAALETLAVIAYRQPVIRAEIEAIRGVQAGPVLRNLLDHKLVRITGRADVPGRPLQYGTTQKFLERFGLASLKDLPSIKEFRSLG